MLHEPRMNRTSFGGIPSRLPSKLAAQMPSPSCTCPARRSSGIFNNAASPGKCYIVGSGPGDPELLTVGPPLLYLRGSLSIPLKLAGYKYPLLLCLKHICVTSYSAGSYPSWTTLQVKAARLLREAEVVVFDDLGTQARSKAATLARACGAQLSVHSLLLRLA